MMKNSIALLVTAMTSLLTGCSLYFGDGNNHGDGDGSWNYCGSDGYYECQDEDCTWRGPSCPSGTDPGGFECKSNEDCAAGCYCGNGICEEAGFCTEDSDCGAGYVCNEDRASCEPGTGPAKCDWDSECQTGEYCAPDHTCVATCTCTDDETAVAGGYGWCDETRSTCLPGQDPSGTCGGTATCNLGAPSCPSGQVPTLIDGCWTGQCRDYNACDLAPECTHINDSANCGMRADCRKVMNGINCHKIGDPNTACNDGDTDCTCDSYVFASCAAN
jgi:hypothetical protein